MMDLLVLYGSPKITGNTALITRQYIKGVRDSHPEAAVSEIYLIDKLIKPCTGCNGCKSGSGKCVITDDMTGMYEMVRRADVLLFSTPIYWWHMTAKLKVFVDRLYAMDFKKDFAGKKLVLISTFGGTVEDSGYGILCDSLEHMSSFLGMEFIHKFGVSTGEKPARDNSAALESAFELGRSL